MHNSTRCDEIRGIFDRYVDKSLKHTWNRRTHGVSVQLYRVLEETQIGHLDTKQYLSSIETKNELSAYLSHKLASAMTSRSIDYVTVYSQSCLTNMQDLNPESMNHNQEEANTSIVLHAIDVTQKSIYVSCNFVLWYICPADSATLF